MFQIIQNFPKVIARNYIHQLTEFHDQMIYDLKDLLNIVAKLECLNSPRRHNFPSQLSGLKHKKFNISRAEHDFSMK